MIATCCHHRCTWETYVNPSFFTEAGLGEEEFALIALLSSWATAAEPASAEGAGSSKRPRLEAGAEVTAEAGAASGAGQKAEAEVAGDAASSEGAPVAEEGSNAAATASADEHSGADPEALRRIGQSLGSRVADAATRKQLGRMCKGLLDTGRLRYLEQHGYTGRLQRYVSAETTPENVVLVAEPSEA